MTAMEMEAVPAVVAQLGAAATSPTCFDEPRRKALARFAEIGLPTRRLEAWKYTDLSAIKEVSFAPPRRRAFTGDLPVLGSGDAHRIVFTNGFPPLPEATTPAPLGIIIDLAAAGPEAAVMPPALEDPALSPMALLNFAIGHGGLDLQVAPGIAAGSPIEVVFVGGVETDATAWHLRHRIEVGRNSSATLIEIHFGAGKGRYLANHYADIVVAENARLRHVIVHDEGVGGVHITTRSVTVAADGRYECFALSCGGRLIRHETSVSLSAPGASCALSGAYLLRDRQHCDTTIEVRHAAPHTVCREVFKGVIDEAARGVFQGRIVVEPGAQKSDGHQLSKALLLSDDAEVDQKPELEIYADDVKCSHGAAVGQLDADEMFYLRSRGIPEVEARRLLIEGFLVEVFDDVTDEDLREALLARARSWFGAKESPTP
jgi:Fe-S cluster assembly protein SufD